MPVDLSELGIDFEKLAEEHPAKGAVPLAKKLACREWGGRVNRRVLAEKLGLTYGQVEYYQNRWMPTESDDAGDTLQT